MVAPRSPSIAARIAGLLFVFGLAVPGHATGPAQARLVHCGGDTCLRLTGHRPYAAVAISVDGQPLAVEGDRRWRATVPLRVARNWPTVAGCALVITLADSKAGTERQAKVMLPPGALGQRVELASLLVHAR